MLRKVLAATLFAGVWVVLDPATAVALTGDNGQVVVDENLHEVQTLSLLIGIILPILVNFFTKADLHPGVRAVVLSALSAISGFGTEYAQSVDQGAFDWYAGLLTALTTFVVAVAVHFGLWAPTGVAERASRSGVK